MLGFHSVRSNSTVHTPILQRQSGGGGGGGGGVCPVYKMYSKYTCTNQWGFQSVRSKRTIHSPILQRQSWGLCPVYNMHSE